MTATVIPQVIEHHHYVHVTSPEPVPAVIRAAIPGQAGDAPTGRN